MIPMPSSADVYGNVREWMPDRTQRYPATGAVHADVEDAIAVVRDSVSRSRRGGAFRYEAAMMRSAGRGSNTAFPFLRRDNVGFQVARSVPVALWARVPGTSRRSRAIDVRAGCVDTLIRL